MGGPSAGLPANSAGVYGYVGVEGEGLVERLEEISSLQAGEEAKEGAQEPDNDR